MIVPSLAPETSFCDSPFFLLSSCSVIFIIKISMMNVELLVAKSVDEA